MTSIDTNVPVSEIDVKSHLRASMDALRAGNIGKAVTEAERARSVEQSAWVLIVFAAISHTMGREADALAMLDQAMRMETNVANYPDAAAAILLKLGRKVDGIFNLKLGTYLPSDEFLNEIVGNYFGDIKGIFDNYIENKPLRTAELMMNQGMYFSAFNQLQTYISVSGGDADSFALIAECALRVGNDNDAEVALRALQALSPSHSRLRDLEFQLAVLQVDEASIGERYKELPVADNVDQATLRARVMISSPYFDSTQIKANLDVISSLVKTVEDIAPPQFDVSDASLVIGFFCISFDASLEALILSLKEKVKIKVYALGSGNSPSQQRLKNAIDDWREVLTIDDATLAEMVRSDELSILFDCAPVGPFSRPGVVRSKVAPIQILWRTDDGYDDPLSYDYRLTDSTSELDVQSDRVIRLDAPLRYPIPPAELMGRITEFRLQDFKRQGEDREQVRLIAPHLSATVTDSLLECWMYILASVPSATLAFIAPSDINNKFVQRILDAAEKHSISDRIDLIDAADFLKSRQEILLDADLVLDRFPRGNSDLVLECIWIGCPALAVWGGQPYDRSAASIARSAGLLELVASDAEDYKKRAISLAKSAKDRKKLRELLKKVNRDLNLSAYDTTANELVEKSDALWRKWCMINA
jgi:hypothetical protein